MAAACKRLAQLSGFRSSIFNSSLRLFSAKGGIGDTTAITRGLEEQGLPKKQAEAITVEVWENFQESFRKRIEMLEESNQLKLKAEVRSQMKLQSEIEKLKIDMVINHNKLRSAIDEAERTFRTQVSSIKYEAGGYYLKFILKVSLFALLGQAGFYLLSFLVNVKKSKERQ
ncbi:hypothetical protein HN51_057400 [Arachis hypogaea]|uniref:uncharacterized protein LOC107621606 n=1 Tax=Arachis ipaensis TaxID=130454 RepID=UPI0007AF14B8|nr:uncharacterized protein LOC107621606 [Arachis ipaensis]QHN80739.1 Coiled-coil domain-containing protein [Arachis hypogaea]